MAVLRIRYMQRTSQCCKNQLYCCALCEVCRCVCGLPHLQNKHLSTATGQQTHWTHIS